MKKKYTLIIASVIIVAIVLIGVYINSKNPLFYISKYTVTSVVALETKDGYKLIDEDKK